MIAALAVACAAAKGIQGIGNGYSEWVSDRDPANLRIRYCVDVKGGRELNYETSVSGNDRETFRIVLRVP